ncbi:TnpV protein [Coprococcus comes]|uniref:TnpV protein n=1 Tax=Coprococcus comes TaxID=410072 RepID=UPI001FAD8BF6|nr:TnpV protein [Coprococcus comes]MDC0786565.1 TnpV protein [Coprococcus comes]MDC0789744.1 TnpV protein [Coprococcus comes]MDC0792943.1 TnpV protein [Coprococcus comes]MDC0796509.1 TnpV protein [Coprococcus comes]
MEKHVYDEKNGLSYTLCGDCYLPDLVLNEEEPTYGKYGMLRKQFLKEYRPIRYQNLLLSGKLTAHLNQIDQEVTELTLLMQIYSCAKEGAQFIIVTHSPILLGIPDADIYCFDNGRIHLCEYEDTESYQVTEMFINNRQMLLDRLLTD